MQIHELKSIKSGRHQRIGRSGKRGSYSGRGVKGQKSRAGRRLRPAERDLIMRIPKRRGYANLPKTDKNVVFNLKEIVPQLKSFADGKKTIELTRDLLRAAGLIKKDFKGHIKLLANGEITFPLVIKSMKVSKSAKMKIEKAGGRVE